jgi:hypothetical protein
LYAVCQRNNYTGFFQNFFSIRLVIIILAIRPITCRRGMKNPPQKCVAEIYNKMNMNSEKEDFAKNI